MVSLYAVDYVEEALTSGEDTKNPGLIIGNDKMVNVMAMTEIVNL